MLPVGKALPMGKALPVGEALPGTVAEEDEKVAVVVGLGVPVGETVGVAVAVGVFDGGTEAVPDGFVLVGALADGVGVGVVDRVGAGAALTVVAWVAVGVPARDVDVTGVDRWAVGVAGVPRTVVVPCVSDDDAGASPAVVAGRPATDAAVAVKTLAAEWVEAEVDPECVDSEVDAGAACEVRSGVDAPASGPAPTADVPVGPTVGVAAAVVRAAGAAPVRASAVTSPAAAATSPPAAATRTGRRRRGPR
jgi:hypothetical protein